MTIANKSLIAILFSLTTALSQARNITLPEAPLQEDGPTVLQTAGLMYFTTGVTIGHIGKQLIKNGYDKLNLDKMPSHLKTPQDMKKYARISIPVGLIAIASPLIFEKAEKLGKEYREQKKEKIRKQQAIQRIKEDQNEKKSDKLPTA